MRWAKDAFYEKGAYGLPRADRIQTPFLRIPEPSFPDSKRFVSDYQHASAYWQNPPPTMPPAQPAVPSSTLPDMRCFTPPPRCTPPSPGECAVARAPVFPGGQSGVGHTEPHACTRDAPSLLFIAPCGGGCQRTWRGLM